MRTSRARGSGNLNGLNFLQNGIRSGDRLFDQSRMSFQTKTPVGASRCDPADPDANLSASTHVARDNAEHLSFRIRTGRLRQSVADPRSRPTWNIDADANPSLNHRRQDLQMDRRWRGGSGEIAASSWASPRAR